MTADRTVGTDGANVGAKSGKTLTDEQIASPARRPKTQEQTLIGLGLNKLNRVRELEDTPAVRGMVRAVAHLVKVEQVDEAQ